MEQEPGQGCEYQGSYGVDRDEAGGFTELKDRDASPRAQRTTGEDQKGR